jgi:molybdate transport system permease protein
VSGGEQRPKRSHGQGGRLFWHPPPRRSFHSRRPSPPLALLSGEGITACAFLISSRRSANVFDITPTEWTAILLSLRVATVATLVATPIGIALAWLLARRNFWGKSLVDALVHLPLVLPPVVTGYLLLLTFGRRGIVGAWLADHLGIVFAFRWTGAALACGVMAFPLLVRPIRLSIEAVDQRLEQAAETLGANRPRVFLTVTLPLALPGVLAGMVLGFAKAIGEFGATITFVSNIPGETQTISSAIYSLIQTVNGDAAALRLVVVSMVIAIAALIGAEWFSRRATQRLHGN